MPDNLIFLGIELLLSKLYVNSYLALLNARRYLGPDGGTPVSRRRSQRVYRPELQANVSHNGSSQTCKADEFQVSDRDIAPEHPAYDYIKAGVAHPIEVVVQMESFSK
ncbi:hypothetical protein AZE42_03739 [Rhizopogon vesiculosus]|uniref:DUF6534 domain-containing protein n=1 Tax=Rhizopogon vesiculosus TaxID=180088 RepID=A0A1J8QGK7_9AGAM|nr:hypothetical protein AZE42_03739 [Rhizopogon vesiculosus]